MQQQRVRKIRVSDYLMADRQWDDGWLDPALARLKRVAVYLLPASNRQTLRWSGTATMVGGLLWIAVLLLPFSSVYPIAFRLERLTSRIISFYPGIGLLVIPMLLFLVGLLGLRAQLEWKPSWIGRIGFVLSFLGLSSSTLATFAPRWLDLDIHISRWLQYQQEPDLSKLFNIDNIGHGFSTSTMIWYNACQLGLTALSIGLVLFGIALVRAKVVSVPCVILLISSSLLIHVPPFLWDLAVVEGRAWEELMFLDGVFTGLLILFGLGWMWLGSVLWSRGSKKQRQSKVS